MNWSIVHSIYIVLGAFSMYLLSNGSIQVMGVYMTSLADEFDVGSAKLGWICSMGFATNCMAGPLTSVFVNRFGYRRVMMAGGSIQAAGLILSYFAFSTAWLFISLGLVTGFGASMVYVSGPILIASYFDKYYSTALGLALAGCAAGIFILPPLLSLFITKYGWRGAVLIHGGLIFNIVAIAASMKQKALKHHKDLNRKPGVAEEIDKGQMEKEPKPYVIKTDDDETSVNKHSSTTNGGGSYSASKWYTTLSHLKLLMNTPIIVLVYAASFCVCFAYSAALIHTSNQIVLKGYSEEEAALSLSLIGIGSVLGRLTQGVLLDLHKLTPRTLYELTLFLAALATFINPIINNYVGFLVSAFCVGFSSGILFTVIYTIMLHMVGKAQLATAIGMELFMDCIGIMAGGYFAGALRDLTGDYRMAFYIFGATYIIGALFFLPLVVLERRNKTWEHVANLEQNETPVDHQGRKEPVQILYDTAIEQAVPIRCV